MNYKSQLKGWAVDRVIELHKSNGDKAKFKGLTDVMADADILSKYAYEPESDFTDAIQRITEILKTSPDAAEKVDLLMGEFGYIREEIERQTRMRAAAGGTPKEALQ